MFWTISVWEISTLQTSEGKHNQLFAAQMGGRPAQEEDYSGCCMAHMFCWY